MPLIVLTVVSLAMLATRHPGWYADALLTPVIAWLVYLSFRLIRFGLATKVPPAVLHGALQLFISVYTLMVIFHIWK